MAARAVFYLSLILVMFFGGSCQNYNRTWDELEPYIKLTRPAGNGPFPAMVLLHGCGGMTHGYDHHWERRLAEWGYVSLQVDSFGPRKISGVCGGGMSSLEVLQFRVRDAFLAKQYLSTLSDVDPDRIGVMGWSHGGTTVIDTMLASIGNPEGVHFDAAVAFYPWCFKPLEIESPLLILTGGLDRWTPAEFCLRHAPVNPSKKAVTIKVYPEAYHCFDWEGIDTVQEGHILRYHPTAAADAYQKVRSFLKKHLAVK